MKRKFNVWRSLFLGVVCTISTAIGWETAYDLARGDISLDDLSIALHYVFDHALIKMAVIAFPVIMLIMISDWNRSRSNKEGK